MRCASLRAGLVCGAVLASGCLVSRGFSVGPVPPRPPDELQKGVWTEMKPGGETRCARGGDYSFWARPGTTGRLVVDFIGGGACWSEATCDSDKFDFSTDLEPLRRIIDSGFFHGIYSRDPAENPLVGDAHVLVPYCTGDIHWGDSTVTYGAGDKAFTIHHKGAVNTRAVLAWIYASFPDLKRIVVSGCSAGAYGAALWSTHLMQHYAGTPVVQLGDAGAGVLTDSFFRDSFPSWHAEQVFPHFIPELDPDHIDIRALGMDDLYIAAARFFPANRFAEFSNERDTSQLDYFARMGGRDPDEWRRRMLASFDRIGASAPNFSSFVGSGTEHCITPSDDFYETEAGGTRFADWFRELVASATAPKSVRPAR